MDDIELTKKAVKELLMEMNDTKESDGLLTERKKNPLGKPNKRFLGRTINSIMKHNKRQSDNNHRKCQRKLRELDAKQRKREYRQTPTKHGKSSHKVINSDSEDSDHNKKKCKNLRKLKRKRRKKQQKSSSSSSSSSKSSSSSSYFSSSSESETSSSKNTSKFKKHKYSKAKKLSSYDNDEENENKLFPQMSCEPSVGYYIDPHMAYAAMAYGHINHVLHQQMVQQQQIIKDELEESVEIPSDLSISYHSESSLNISLHSSSAEEDENGILTFKLLSSDEERTSSNTKEINQKGRTDNLELITLVESDNSNISSAKSCISLESKTSQNPNEQTNEIFLLSSSTSDCDDLEIIETESGPANIHLKIALDKDKEDAFESIETNNNMDKKEENLPENEIEEDRSLQLDGTDEKTNKEIEEKQNDDSTENNEIIKKMKNAEESGKNISLPIQLPENNSNTAMIDLTEE